MLIPKTISRWHHAYIVHGTRSSFDDIANDSISNSTVRTYELSGETLSIDEARRLGSYTHDKTESDEHVIVIAEFETITREAQHALLKTLEEPAPRTHIVIILPRVDFLIDTIFSRVHILETTSETDELDTEATTFISSTISDRITFVENRTKDKENPLTQSEVLKFITHITRQIAKLNQSDVKESALRVLTDAERYAHHQGMPNKMVLEYLATTMPQTNK